MKRFWLFMYEDYYPSGGMRDFRGDFDTREEVLKALYAIKDAPENFEIVDTQEHLIATNRGYYKERVVEDFGFRLIGAETL